MLIGKDIIDSIDDIVERAYVGFMFDILGEDYLSEEQKAQIEGLGILIGTKPLIELVYLLVRQRSEERYLNDKSLQMLLDEIAISGVLPEVSDSSRATIENASNKMHQSIVDTKDMISKKVKEEIFTVNKKEKDHMQIIGPGNVISEIERKDKAIDGFAIGIGLLILPIAAKFAKGFISTLTDTVNEAVVDEALATGTALQTKVYKKVTMDGHQCQWCTKFYLEDGKPKIYNLNDLIANGSNDGKSKSAWLPVVGKTHYNCRCQMFTQSQPL